MAGYGELYGGTFGTGYGSTNQGPSQGEYAIKHGAISAATGAAVGAAVGSVVPVLGTAVGALLGGAVGGVFGGFGGSASAKAKRYARLAAQVQQQREANKDYHTFLQFIRQQRLAQAATEAMSVASGTEMSSKTAGALSGQQSQTAYSVQFLAEDRRLQALYESYMRRAGKASSIAGDLNAGFNTLLQIGMSFAAMNAGNGGTTATTEATPKMVEGTIASTPGGVPNPRFLYG